MAKFTLSVDDGCSSDVRVAELATKYKIDTVFYWPVEWHSLAYDKGYEPLDLSDAFGISMRFEVGAHTITHRHLTKIPIEEAKKEIEYSKFLLDKVFEINITKFCPPRGYTNEELTEYTLKHFESQRLTKGEGLVHIHPNSGANNNVHWIEYYEQEKAKGTRIELWGHSHEWDKFGMWQEIEDFLREHTHSE